MQQTVRAFIYLDEGHYTAECHNLPVVTQGASLDEAVNNLREAVALALSDGDYQGFGFTSDAPPIIVTLELASLHAA